MQPLLELHNIYYSYHTLDGETSALSDLSFSIQSGEFVAIVGPSGCGKSTLLSLICGLMQPESGEILLNGIPLNHISIQWIGYMLQHDHLLEWRTIYRNVILGPEITGTLTKLKKEKARKLLAQYGLAQFSNSRPSELSGGMRQRAALIRTLLPDPQLLLLDEPFSALDYQTRLSVSNDIGQIIRNSGKTAILVTHDLSEAISLADRIIILSRRPATVQSVLRLSFHFETTCTDQPDSEQLKDTPLNRRNTPEFKQYFNQIWKELNPDELTTQTNFSNS